MSYLPYSPEDWARLGKELRRSRDFLAHSRESLADITGVSVKSIQNAEEGRVPSRWPQSLERIALALGWEAGSVHAVLKGGEPTVGSATPRLYGPMPSPVDARPLGPLLTFTGGPRLDGTTSHTAVDHAPPEDPRDRAICRALLVHALNLLDAAERGAA